MESNILRDIIYLTTFVNPLALFSYLKPVRDDLNEKDFFTVLLKASVISLVINLFFTFTGEFMFSSVFKISFLSFRIFGGIVLFSLAVISIIQGKKALITIRGSLDDLASEIALPFMTGVGTISMCILIGSRHSAAASGFIVAVSMLITVVMVMLISYMSYHMPNKKLETAFDKFLGVFIRINGFFMGAIGIDMALNGIVDFVRYL
jgi:multiple antibiotic resistance protein